MPELIRDVDWPTRGRGRVLVEAIEWTTRDAIVRMLREAGYAPADCPGPAGADERCALATETGCAAAHGADVVVHALSPGDPRNREALLALRRRLPDTPLVVEVTAAALRSRPQDYEGCVVVTPPVSKGALLDAVEQAFEIGAGRTTR